MQVRGEIWRLEQAKEATERECEARIDPLNVAMNCLTIRERRREGDVVKDQLEVHELYYISFI